MLIDCRQAHWLMSKHRDAPLPWRERLALQVHLLFCDWCGIVRRNFAFLSRATRDLDRRP